MSCYIFVKVDFIICIGLEVLVDSLDINIYCIRLNK